MGLVRIPFELAALTPAAQKPLATPPGSPVRTMAAKGLLPLAPADQLVVLYQLALDSDRTVAQLALQAAQALPDKIVEGLLADASLPPQVLDFLAEALKARAPLLEDLLQHPQLADETVVTLAQHGGDGLIDRIAQNEQRLLRCPEIIAAMYLNRRARMSTVDRAVELAVRNQIRVPGIAAWDEISRALLDKGRAPTTADADALFAQAAEACAEVDDEPPLVGGEIMEVDDTADPSEETELAALMRDDPTDKGDKAKKVEKLSLPAKIRLASVGNAFARSLLVRDPIKIVAMAAIKAQSVTENEVVKYAKNNALCDDVIRYIASKKEWTKVYTIKFALCLNPKCPLSEAMRLLPFLRDKDLKTVSKSKGIPSALTQAARKLAQARAPGAGK